MWNNEMASESTLKMANELIGCNINSEVISLSFEHKCGKALGSMFLAYFAQNE